MLFQLSQGDILRMEPELFRHFIYLILILVAPFMRRNSPTLLVCYKDNFGRQVPLIWGGEETMATNWCRLSHCFLGLIVCVGHFLEDVLDDARLNLAGQDQANKDYCRYSTDIGHLDVGMLLLNFRVAPRRRSNEMRSR